MRQHHAILLPGPNQNIPETIHLAAMVRQEKRGSVHLGDDRRPLEHVPASSFARS